MGSKRSRASKQMEKETNINKRPKTANLNGPIAEGSDTTPALTLLNAHKNGQTHVNGHSLNGFHSHSNGDELSTQSPIQDDFAADRDRLMQRFRIALKEDLVQQLAAGQPTYYGGTGADAGKLFMHTPDGLHLEYRVRPDGTREIVRIVPR